MPNEKGTTTVWQDNHSGLSQAQADDEGARRHHPAPVRQ